VYEGPLAARFHVSKYPTLKLFRYGAQVKREYRGQRSVTALTNFIRTQLVVPVTRINTPDDIYNIDVGGMFYLFHDYICDVGGNVFKSLFCLFVCLSVSSVTHSCGLIFMKFSGV